jgi:hypothetical protein
MASRARNGGIVWQAGAWAGLVLLVALDASLLMLLATPGHQDRPDVQATRRATGRLSGGPASRTARQDGVRPISDLLVPR